ncbi:MAG: MBL fold metallo-hydrolase [Erysipelotrichaceae bacterium]|jgi:glyoxylase-like metal-dependent hydrolase (beta-lactamase superfamily II)|nr:MBL fold metallo-hydrolase [Erysipelotrichaceae bacterium]
MPGPLTNSKAINGIPRPIKSDLKSKRIIFEPEHVVRWSFLKVLREFSTLKEFYPEINPYTECYKVRDNTWALFNESFDGAGDVWMYLINGPKKALIVDTSFGVGDLKGLIRHLVGDKEVIVCNTHHHFDHCYGNAQFDTCYCHENEVFDIQSKNNPDIWDYLFNQTGETIVVGENEEVKPGEPVYTHFDKKDLIVDLDHKENYKPYNVVGVPDGYEFDLGDGYLVEAVLIPGHSAGQCAYYDKHNGTIFIGDCTGVGGRTAGPHQEFCTVEAMHDALIKLQPRLKDMTGVFPGHGMFDTHPIMLQYLLDTTEQVLKNPENYDKKTEMVRGDHTFVSYTKNIHQWTALRYSPTSVYKNQRK